MTKRKHETFPDYGYRVNINAPGVRELYYRYKKWRGIPRWCPLSDAQRREFERYVLREDKNERDFV